METNRQKLKNFLRFLEWTSALGLGGLAAFIFSLKQVNPVVEFRIDVWTWIVFAVAGVACWWAIRAVLSLAEGKSDEMSPSQYRRAKIVRMTLLAGVLFGGTFASFYWSLRNVSPAKRFDVAVGTGTAILFISMAMFGFWRLVRFLERHGNPEADEEEENRDRSEEP